ncbi:MAG: hypothetical protein AAF998_06915 [Bacteroidota bacterium]
MKNPIAEFEGLSDLIQKWRSSVLIPYSDAHLDDLIPSKGPAYNDFIEKDLENISKLTAGHCLVQYFGKDKVVPEITAPARFYKEQVERRGEKLFDWDELISELNEFGMGDAITELLKVGTGIDVEAIKQDTETFESLAAMLPRTMDGGTLLDVVKDLQDLSNNMWAEPDRYKEIRSQVKDNVELPREVSNWENVIERLDATLPNTTFGRDFSGFTLEYASKNGQDNQVSRYSYFIATYMNLDLLGFRPEKITQKNGFPNFLNDARHAFYAGHCDYYITNDKKGKHKAKAVFEHLKIETEVLNVSEFIEQVGNWKPLLHSHFDFLDQVVQILELPGWDLVVSEDGAGETTYRRELDHKFLNFFNTVYRSLLPSGENKIHFVWEPTTYSEFWFFKEIETLVNHLVEVWGEDHTGVGMFTESEISCLLDAKWAPRRWRWEFLGIDLHYQGLFGIAMTLTITSK